MKVNMSVKEEWSRTARIYGESAVEKLAASRIAVFGVGGVGGFACEALARAGIGSIDIFDKDTVSLSNINRQIIALHSTVGKSKVEIMKERIEDINPDCNVNAYNVFYLPQNADEYDLSIYDYVIDAFSLRTAETGGRRRSSRTEAYCVTSKAIYSNSCRRRSKTYPHS